VTENKQREVCITKFKEPKVQNNTTNKKETRNGVKCKAAKFYEYASIQLNGFTY